MNPTIKQMLNSVCVWLDSTAVSQMIQSVTWMVPLVQTVHILAIAALMAAMLMFNLRLAGKVGGSQPMLEVSRRTIPVIWWALPVLLATGALLVVGEPARSLKNNVFQLKMLLVIAAIFVTLYCSRPLERNPGYWDGRRGLGSLMALVSVLLWVGIIFAGRWIAYA